MKKILLIFVLMLLMIADGYSQVTFNTGALQVNVSNYGRIRLLTPSGTRNLQRATILVGTTPTAVFDYTNDAGTVTPAVLITNPTLSDFEIYNVIDNSDSGLPPDVTVKINAYGWTNGSYTLVKFNIKNDATTPVNAVIGLDIIPEIDQTYGFDSVTYNSSAGVIRFHRGAVTNMGMKLLSASLFSLHSFEWYDGYTVDADYWNWMNLGTLQPEYASNTADGPVTITSQNPIALGPGQAYDVFYALALGTNEQTMLANISAAEQKYQSLFTSVGGIKPAVTGFNLGQNSPDPFNNSTTISYQLPEDGFVSLKVHNIIGNEVAVLVNSSQTKGSHIIDFNANGLTSGVYYYTLRFGDQVRSNKMLLIK